MAMGNGSLFRDCSWGGNRTGPDSESKDLKLEHHFYPLVPLETKNSRKLTPHHIDSKSTLLAHFLYTWRIMSEVSCGDVIRHCSSIKEEDKTSLFPSRGTETAEEILETGWYYLEPAYQLVAYA